MSISWYLVKYMPDSRRREPKNVGIVLETPGPWLSKFVGEVTPGGAIDGRSIRHWGLEKDVYETWVFYYRRKAAGRDWDSVKRLELRPHGQANFFTELGGHYLGAVESYQDLLSELFSQLVGQIDAAQHPSAVGSELNSAVRSVLARAHIQPCEHVKVKGKYSEGGRETELTFSLGYQNGRQHLMEPLTLTRSKRAESHARELRTRMEAARRVDSSSSFIAFYSLRQAKDERTAEDVLLPLEGEALTINVDDEGMAVETVASLMTH